MWDDLGHFSALAGRFAGYARNEGASSTLTTRYYKQNPSSNLHGFGMVWPTFAITYLNH